MCIDRLGISPATSLEITKWLDGPEKCRSTEVSLVAS